MNINWTQDNLFRLRHNAFRATQMALHLWRSKQKVIPSNLQDVLDLIFNRIFRSYDSGDKLLKSGRALEAAGAFKNALGAWNEFQAEISNIEKRSQSKTKPLRKKSFRQMELFRNRKRLARNGYNNPQELLAHVAQLERASHKVRTIWSTFLSQGDPRGDDELFFEEHYSYMNSERQRVANLIWMNDKTYADYLLDELGFESEEVEKIASDGNLYSHKMDEIEYAIDQALEYADMISGELLGKMEMMNALVPRGNPSKATETWALRAVKMRERAMRNYQRAMNLIASLNTSGIFPKSWQGDYSHELESMNIKMGTADAYMREGKMKNSLKFWSRAAIYGEGIIGSIINLHQWIIKHGRFPTDDEGEEINEDFHYRWWDEGLAPDLPGAYYGADDA